MDKECAEGQGKDYDWIDGKADPISQVDTA